MTNYLVCATQRTGSNLLCSLLEASGVAGMTPDARVIQERGLLAIIPDPHAPDGRPVCDVQGRDEVQGFLADCFDDSRTPNGVGGWKLMLSHLMHLAKSVDGPEASAEAALDLLPDDTRFILLHRRDTLAQAISMTRAVNTQCWDSRARKAFSGWEHFDAHEARARMPRITRGEATWRKLLAPFGDRVIELHYEDLADDRATVLRDTLDHIGQSWPDDLEVEDGYDRQADARTLRLRAAVERLDELTPAQRRLDRLVRKPVSSTARLIAKRRTAQRIEREWGRAETAADRVTQLSKA